MELEELKYYIRCSTAGVWYADAAIGLDAGCRCLCCHHLCGYTIYTPEIRNVYDSPTDITHECDQCSKAVPRGERYFTEADAKMLVALQNVAPEIVTLIDGLRTGVVGDIPQATLLVDIILGKLKRIEEGDL